MIDAIIGSMVGGIIGVVAFVVIKAVVTAQTTTTWSAADIAIITVIPTAIGILTLVGVFTALQSKK